MRRLIPLILILSCVCAQGEVQSLQAIVKVFHITTAGGVLQDADSTPTGALYLDGTANGATVTVTKLATGTYKAAVTCPELTAGQVVDLRIAATVDTVATARVVLSDFADTHRTSDVAGTAASIEDKMDTALMWMTANPTPASTSDIAGLNNLSTADVDTVVANNVSTLATIDGKLDVAGGVLSNIYAWVFVQPAVAAGTGDIAGLNNISTADVSDIVVNAVAPLGTSAAIADVQASADAAARPGDEMDLVDAPNATAILAIQTPVTSGTHELEWTFTKADLTPIEGVRAYLSSDTAGGTPISSQDISDAAGKAQMKYSTDMVGDTVYLQAFKAGYSFTYQTVILE